jgi:hypothetical protein
MITHTDIKGFWQLPETERQKLRIAVEMQEPKEDAEEDGEDFDEECPTCEEGMNGYKFFFCETCLTHWRLCEECNELFDEIGARSLRGDICDSCFEDLKNDGEVSE